MAIVRLIFYNTDGSERASIHIDGPTLLDAATNAAVYGMTGSLDFHVCEPEGERLTLYWVGRREQKCSREEAREILARKGI